MKLIQESPFRPSAESLLVFSLLAVLILAALWPWPLHFRTGFPDHFDPPFHAWKLQVGADKILRHQLVPDTQTNVYYPYANEFYFDALLWPQAMLAALLGLAGCGPVLTYNLVFLFFWALSGLCMYLVLRELGLVRLPALFGGAAMCLIPYRISYYVEFNMQMCFGLPLFLLFWVRYARRPGMGNAIGLGLAFWLQAVSELYQAVILALSFPLLALPYLHDIFRRHGRRPRLYLSVAAGLATVVPLCLLYLEPYFTLFQGGYGRSASEMTRHSLEPLAYLGRWLPALILPPATVDRIKFDEMSVFPSLTLLLLVAGYATATRHLFRHAAPDGRRDPADILRMLRFTGLAVFAGLVLYLGRFGGTGSGPLLFWLGNGSLVLALAATLFLAVLDPPEQPAARLCRGLAAAALLCFILSLGPTLMVLSDRASGESLVFSLVSHVFPLNGFRVMSRFSIIVMIFLVVAGACFLARLAERRPMSRWLVLPALLALLLEAHAIPHPYRRYSLPIARSTLDAIRSRDASFTVVPLGKRSLDARYMLGIGSTRTLLVNGFGGFAPALQLKIGRALRQRPDRAFSLISSIWPPSMLIVDRQALARFNAVGYATTEAMVRARGTLVTADRNFALYAMNEPDGPVDEYRRFVRSDFLRASPLFSFEARSDAPGGQDLFVLLNGTVVAAVHATADWRQHRILLPRAGITGIDYEMVFVRGLDGQGPWMARNGTFGPAPASAPGKTPDYAGLATWVWRQGAPSWMHYVTALPSAAVAVNLEFRNHVRLVGIELPRRPVVAGETVRLRTFWTIPSSLGRVALVARIGFAGPEGEGFSSSRALVHRMPVTFIISQPVGKIFVEPFRLVVPATAAAADYRFQVQLREAVSGRPIRASAILPPEQQPILRIGEAAATGVSPRQHHSIPVQSDHRP